MSWNINPVRRRIEQLDRLVDETSADIVCLQETKVADSAFPANEISALGYQHQAVAGFSGYNGVTILSKHPLTQIQRHLHCDRDDARHISASILLSEKEALSIHNVYVPTGGNVPDASLSPKFAHKMQFIDSIVANFAGQFEFRENLIVWEI